MTLIMALDTECWYAEGRSAVCRDYLNLTMSVVTLHAILLSVGAPHVDLIIV